VYALSFLHVKASGLVPSLRALARQFTATWDVPAELRVEGRIPALPDEVESALYRVAHEALVNVERHARATGVLLALRGLPDAVELCIRDDGVGLDQRQAADWRSAAHFGMRSMARAVEQAGGRFDAGPGRPRGLTIRARVPMRVPAGKTRR
jgi:signal transduction histidine kinase